MNVYKKLFKINILDTRMNKNFFGDESDQIFISDPMIYSVKEDIIRQMKKDEVNYLKYLFNISITYTGGWNTNHDCTITAVPMKEEVK